MRAFSTAAAVSLSAVALLSVAGCPQPIRQGADGGADASVPAADGSTTVDGGAEDGGMDACVPKTCAELSGACGMVSDGCGGSLSCSCGFALTCLMDGGTSGTCGCPSTAFQTRIADTGAGYTGLYNSMVVDRAGGVHVAYVDGDDGFKYLYQPTGAASFVPTVEPVDTSAPVSGTAIAVDEARAVHVVYYRWSSVSSNIWDAEVWYARRAPNGGWTSSRVMAAGQMVYARADYAAIAIDPAGTLHLLYYTFTYQSADLWHASSATGTGWTTTRVQPGTEIGSTWSAAGTLALHADAAGRLHALFFDYDKLSLHYASRPAGGTWVVDAAAVAVPQVSGEWAGAFSSLVVDGTGTLHVSYVREQSTSSALWYAVRAPGAVAWSTEQIDPATGTTARVGTYNAMIRDAAGGLHIAHYDGTGQDLRYTHRPSGGAWTSEPAETSGSVGSHAALGIDSQGSLHVAFFDLLDRIERKGQLRYATRCR